MASAARSFLAVVVLAAPPVASAPEDDGTARRAEAYFHLMAARLALADGRASEVAREVRLALEKEPDQSDLQGEGALLLAMVGRRTDAEDLAREALRGNPEQPAALRVLADLAASRSFGPAADPEARLEAIRLYETLARSDERSPDELWAVLARLKLAAGFGEGAVTAARTFLEKRPGEPGAIRLLAQTLEAVGRKAEALDVLLSWIRQHPEGDSLIGWISEWSRGVERWEQVESAMSDVLEARPDSAPARGLRGEARLRLGRPEEAIEDLGRALEASPDSVLLRFQLATAYGAANRLAEATNEARSLAADLPDNAAVRGMLGDALARQGDLRGASSAYASAVRSLSGTDRDAAARRDDLRLRLATVFLRLEEFASAERTLNALEEPEGQEAVEVRGELALRQQKPEQVRRWAEVLRESGHEGSALLLEARSNVLDDRLERAESRFSEAAKILGPSALLSGAIAMRESGHAKRGERLLEEWVRAEPDSAEARFQLGGYLERTSDFARAEPVLREALRLAPDSAEVMNYLGYSLADRGLHLDEALVLARRAVAADPWNGAYLDSLGWTLYRMGRFEEARGPLEGAAGELPFDPTILSHLGDLYAELGMFDRAAEAWSRAIEVGADNADELRKKLGRLSDGNARP
jgi:tetratricopeptide (TPR) repeat protein